MRLRPYGDRAVLLEVAGADEVLALQATLLDAPPDGLAELIPAADSVLAVFADAGACRTARASLLAALDDASAPSSTPDGADPEVDRDAPVTVEVVYDGEDLDAVAEATGLTADEVVAAHTAGTYRVAFCGFVPGFSYLVGLDPRLHLPRRDTPRTRVPAGAVAIAGPHTAVYPRASPGGWSLLGRTDLRVWDVTRDPPTRLPPGAAVRFVAVDP